MKFSIVNPQFFGGNRTSMDSLDVILSRAASELKHHQAKYKHITTLNKTMHLQHQGEETQVGRRVGCKFQLAGGCWWPAKVFEIFESTLNEQTKDNALQQRYPKVNNAYINVPRRPHYWFVDDAFNLKAGAPLADSWMLAYAKMVVHFMLDQDFEVDLENVVQKDGSSVEGLAFRRKVDGKERVYVMTILPLNAEEISKAA